jgi:hypothetical protein
MVLTLKARIEQHSFTEILAEINREVVRTSTTLLSRCTGWYTTAGTFDLDVDSNGRWSVEKFKGLDVPNRA